MTPNNDDMKSETKIGGVLAPLTATGSPLEIKVVQNQPKIVSSFCIENCTFKLFGEKIQGFEQLETNFGLL